MTPLTKLAIPPGPRPKPGSSGALSPLPSYYVSPMGNHANWLYHQVRGPGGIKRRPGDMWHLEHFREISFYHQVHSKSLGAPGLPPLSPPTLVGAGGRAVADPRWRTTGDRRAENPAQRRRFGRRFGRPFRAPFRAPVSGEDRPNFGRGPTRLTIPPGPGTWWYKA